MNLVMDEQTRIEILLAKPYDFFPPPFVALVASYLKKKDHYIIFMDHAELPVWKVRRGNREFIYELGDAVHYDITVILRDSGSIAFQFYDLNLAKEV